MRLTGAKNKSSFKHKNMQTIAKVSNKNYLVDLTAQRIDFLDNRFYYTEQGISVPSVTTILEAYPKGAAFYEWLKKNGEDSDTIRDDAGRRGSTVHELTERYDNGEEVTLMDENGFIGFRMIEWAMFERWVEFRNRFPFEVDATEVRLVSSELGFAGTLDRVITLNGQRILIDIKTSGSVWPSYWLQLAAYKKLLEEKVPELPICQVAILWLNAKTKTDGKKDTVQGKGWQLIIRDQNEMGKDWALFVATHKLWTAENGEAKPKQISYSIKHQLK